MQALFRLLGSCFYGESYAVTLFMMTTMTEQDILRKQEQNANTEFYLMLVGQFYHAYGHGAFALARATGYHVLRKQRKAGQVLMAGFPIGRLSKVKECIEAKGGHLREVENKLLIFHGVDGTPDDGLVKEMQAAPVKVENACTAPPPSGHACGLSLWQDALCSDILNFDLAAATPLEAMLFVAQLQQKIKRQAWH